MMRFNYIRILLILMLCTDVLSAQESSMDSLNIIHDTAKPVIEPLLMIFYGGELDSFMYEQMIEEVVFDTVFSSDPEQGIAAPPLTVADTAQQVIITDTVKQVIIAGTVIQAYFPGRCKLR